MKDVYDSLKIREFKKLRRLSFLTLQQLRGRLTIEKKKLGRIEYNKRLEKRYNQDDIFYDKRPIVKEEIKILEKAIKEKEAKGDKK